MSSWLTRNSDGLYIREGTYSVELVDLTTTDGWDPGWPTGPRYSIYQEVTLSGHIGKRIFITGWLVCPDAFFDTVTPNGTAFGGNSAHLFGLSTRARIVYYTVGDAVISSQTGAWSDYGGVRIAINELDTPTLITPEWTEMFEAFTTVVPATTSYAKVYWDFKNNHETTQITYNDGAAFGGYFDSFYIYATDTTLTLEDTYALLDREMMAFDAIYQSDDGKHTIMNVTSRGQLGTLASRHKKKQAKGKIVKVRGGAASYADIASTTNNTGGRAVAHPLNILMSLLTTTNQGTSFYFPDGTAGAPGAGHNMVANGATYYGWDKGDGWGLGIPIVESATHGAGYTGYIDWQAIRTLIQETNYTLYRSEFRFTKGIKDFKEWAEREILRPFGFRWSLGTSAGYEGAISVARMKGVAPGSTVATLTERDMEGLPDIGYTNAIVNQIRWQFDDDVSQQVDNRQDSKFLSLNDYNEASFWNLTTGTSSYDKYDEHQISIKSAGLRGVTTARFANGYAMQGHKIARMVSYDLLRRWRENLPVYRFKTGMKFMNIDVGDVIEIDHDYIWDFKSATQGVAKECEITSIRHDYSKKQIKVEAVSLSDIVTPSLYTGLATPSAPKQDAGGITDIYLAHLGDGEAAKKKLQQLGLYDYPYYYANLFFVCQCYGATHTDLTGDGIGDTTFMSNLLWRRHHAVPDFAGYRHTNVYVALDGTNYVKVAETNEKYIYFQWKADNDLTGADGPPWDYEPDEGDGVPAGPKVRVSYSNHEYTAATGEYEEGGASTYNLIAFTYGACNLNDRNILRTLDRRENNRSYLRIGGPSGPLDEVMI